MRKISISTQFALGRGKYQHSFHFLTVFSGSAEKYKWGFKPQEEERRRKTLVKMFGESGVLMDSLELILTFKDNWQKNIENYIREQRGALQEEIQKG